MAGLDPAIHVFKSAAARKNVDARHKAGHDDPRASIDLRALPRGAALDKRAA
jgi:hypothetical protein